MTVKSDPDWLADDEGNLNPQLAGELAEFEGESGEPISPEREWFENLVRQVIRWVATVFGVYVLLVILRVLLA